MKIELFYYLASTAISGDPIIEILPYDTRKWDDTDRIYIKSEMCEIPDCELPAKSEIKAALIGKMEAEKSKILAETHQKIARLDDRINQLLCLEVTA